MFKLVNVTKTYRGGDVRTTALDRIDLDIAAGEYLAITGPSGCGKSTLLAMLGLLDTPDSGECWFDGRNVALWSAAQLNGLRRGRIGFIFQDFNRMNDLVDGCRVEGEINLYGKTSTARARMLPSCVVASAWCSRSLTRSPRPSTKTWLDRKSVV